MKQEAEVVGYTNLNETEHEEEYIVNSRTLYCETCEEEFQTIIPHGSFKKVEKHHFYWNPLLNQDSNELPCVCGATKAVMFPCGHTGIRMDEQGYFHCVVCGRLLEVNSGDSCVHAHYTFIADGSTKNEYERFNQTLHLKRIIVRNYNADWADWRFAYCDDCGKLLSFRPVSDEPALAGTERYFTEEAISSVLGQHTFENEVCTACGEEAPYIELEVIQPVNGAEVPADEDLSTQNSVLARRRASKSLGRT